MVPLMKFNSLRRFNILEVISNYKFPLKRSSTQILKEKSATGTKRKKKKNLFTPLLTEEKLKALNDITTISVEMNHVSWAKMSTLNFSLLEWNAFELPNNFRFDMNEFEILNLGNLVKNEIPSSDLYVLENFRHFRAKVNELYLKVALITHISSFNKDSAICDNIVFQHPMVLNVAYKLLVGGERRTTKQIVENIFLFQQDQNCSNDNILSISSFSKISKEKIQHFASCNRTKQESLSLALLINLSFLHLNFFENQKHNSNRNVIDSIKFN